MAAHTKLLALCLLLFTCYQCILTFPHSSVTDNDDMEIVMVEEIVHYTNAGGPSNSSAALITLDEQNTADANADNASVMDTADDLIFLAKKPQKHQNQPADSQSEQHEQTDAPYQQIDLLTSDEEDSLTSEAAAGVAATPDSAEHIHGIPHEIELRTEHYNSGGNSCHQQHHHSTTIDMSDFVALIPAAEVKSIAANYYRNDPDVQRAYAYLSTSNFAALKRNIIATPEMSAFLRYLNNSGLDVLQFFETITNLTSNASEMETNYLIAVDAEREVKMRNEITKTQEHTTTINLQTSAATGTKEELNGLHGLVDSILNILPQDQILATFFDKLETNEQFSKLVDSLSTPLFARTLNNLQNSVALRNLIFTLHNNGIYITRIVDSLKAYFFLGTF